MTKQEIIDNFSTSLERQRIELGLSQSKMANKLDLSLSTYKSLVNGQTQKIDVYTLVKLYELTGKFACEFLDIDDRKTKIVSKLNHLSDQQLMMIHSVVELERVFRVEHSDCDDYVTLFIPTGDFQDGMIYDSTHVDKVNVAAYRNKFGNRIHYAIEITSEHLAPVYHDGDILLIAKEPIRDGDIGLFLNKDDARLYVRKYRKGNPTILEPINDYGIEFEVYNLEDKEKWVKFGKVLTKMR